MEGGAGGGGGGGGGEIHNMTRQIALKSFLHVSDNPHINFLAGSLLYLCLFLV